MIKKHILLLLPFIFIFSSVTACLPSRHGKNETPVAAAEGSQEGSKGRLEVFAEMNAGVGGGILFDGEGNMFVGVQGELLKITPDGNAVLFCDLKGLPKGRDYYFASPVIWDMAMDQDKNILAAAQDRILKITPDAHVTTLIREDFNGFLGASGLELDKKGNLYVTDGGKVIRYTPQLEKSVFIDATGGEEPFNSFFSLEFDPDYKNLYVSDFHTKTLLKYPVSKSGKPGKPTRVAVEPVKGAGPFGAPLNITFDSEKNMYVSIDGTGQVLKADRKGGTELLTLRKHLRNHIIAFGGKGFDSGSLYVSTYSGDAIYKFSLDTMDLSK